MAGIKVDNTWEVTETQEVVRKYTLEEVINAIANAELDKARAQGVIDAYTAIKVSMETAGIVPSSELEVEAKLLESK